MKALLTITAIFEGITGLSLITVPALIVSILFGVSIEEPIGIIVSRLAGVTLLSIVIACWMYRHKSDADGIIKALLFYNMAASALLVYAWMAGFTGLGIWPASLLHIGMAVWCVKAIQGMPGKEN